ncbi:MAG TPA: bifunctional diaminohydroxyphosphoribosylaminopyrimidine deaminase/5-amino-6-(5-phosphoribosylamino)uracil reductase RibD [Bacteroidota bacterium]|nr:bifunctional diaminohydroxyphosphoribosylaminopyrimidine deaminase/5-amino-6-(5-phosphoribosylamino)uracil reductase RibD [Bacteroidota bacterium]
MNSSYLHPEFIRRCFELAKKGELHVTPNPQVGCVIVKDGRIIAEGYHKQFGKAHAEIEALRIAGERGRGATMYVNLEPCSHFGKTPPCADAIIKAGISKVVASIADPNPQISGRGFQRLRKAGIAVETGILAEEATRLNERFVYYMKKRKPFVGIKVAQTLDGLIADVRRRSQWITSPGARQEAHRLRAIYESVLIGAGTAIKDNPELTVRLVKGRNPTRIVVDGRLRCPPNLKLFDTRHAKTIVLTSRSAFHRKKALVQQLERKGVSVITAGASPQLSVTAIQTKLSTLGISSVLIEGGGETVSRFLEKPVANKIHVFVAPKILGGGLTSFSLRNPRILTKALTLNGVEVRCVGDDVLVEGYFR